MIVKMAVFVDTDGGQIQFDGVAGDRKMSKLEMAHALSQVVGRLIEEGAQDHGGGRLVVPAGFGGMPPLKRPS